MNDNDRLAVVIAASLIRHLARQDLETFVKEVSAGDRGLSR